MPYLGVYPEHVVMLRVEWDDPVDLESIVYLNYRSTYDFYAYACAYDADLDLINWSHTHCTINTINASNLSVS